MDTVGAGIIPPSSAIKHAFPLTNLSFGYDVKNGIGELHPAEKKEYSFDDDKPVGVNFTSVVFKGQDTSYVEVPVSVSDPALNHFYTVSMYVKPTVTKEMSILAYESDKVTQGMVSMELWTDGADILVSLENSDGIKYSQSVHNDVLVVGQWTFLAFNRDQDDTHQRIGLTVDSVCNFNFFTSNNFTTNHRMFKSGKLRIGGSFKGRNTFEGKVSCVMVAEEAITREADNIGKELYCHNTANWLFPPATYLQRPSGHFSLLHRDLSPNALNNLGLRTVSSSRRCVDICLKTSGCESVLMNSADKTCEFYGKHDIYSFSNSPNTKYYIATSYTDK